MRWVRILQSNIPTFGIVEGEDIRIVDGTPFGDYRPTGVFCKLRDARLLPPVMPRTFYAVGFNYLGHTEEARAFSTKANKVPTKPDVGYRSTGALIGHNEAIVIPAESSGVVQFEGELVAVIGRTARNVPETEVQNYLLGYTIGNDVSERSWQKSDRTVWRSKNTDTFKPMGPWIETDATLSKMETEVRLNSQVVSRFKTDTMIFGVAQYIAEITRFVTMHPGDVIWMGTEAPTLDMRAGDVVEIEIAGIGSLRSLVTAERSGKV